MKYVQYIQVEIEQTEWETLLKTTSKMLLQELLDFLTKQQKNLFTQNKLKLLKKKEFQIVHYVQLATIPTKPNFSNCGPLEMQWIPKKILDGGDDERIDTVIL